MSYLPCSRFRIVTQWHAYIQQENNVSSFIATSVQDTSQWALPNENLPTREPNFLESRRALPTTTNSTTNHTALETLTEEEKTKTKMWLKGISYLSAWLQILKNNCDETHTPSAGAQSHVTTGWLLHWARSPLLQGEHSHASPPCSGGKVTGPCHHGSAIMWVFRLQVWTPGENPTWAALQHPCTILHILSD